MKGPGSYVYCLLILLICKQRKVRRTAKWFRSGIAAGTERVMVILLKAVDATASRGQNRYVKEHKEVASKQLKAIPLPASGNARSCTPS